jgi:hypothetical protein
MRRAHSFLFRTTRKTRVVGALFLFVIVFVFLVRHGLEISVGRGFDGLDHAAKAGIVVRELSLRSLHSPRGTELGTELCVWCRVRGERTCPHTGFRQRKSVIGSAGSKGSEVTGKSGFGAKGASQKEGVIPLKAGSPLLDIAGTCQTFASFKLKPHREGFGEKHPNRCEIYIYIEIYRRDVPNVCVVQTKATQRRFRYISHLFGPEVG